MKLLKVLFPLTVSALLFVFCTSLNTKEKSNLQNNKNFKELTKHPKFNKYWYQGKAEITSYKLSQERYGEIHNGTAVTIFVTEDFLPEKQVKADTKNDKNIPVLKLNSTKKFVTGIYPYSLMTSTFSPIKTKKQALKISFSAQEWCGNSFVQLNNLDDFKIDFHSYFESNSDKKIALKKNILENEIWNLLRINPYEVPKGKIKIIPSLEYLTLYHQKIKAYNAETNLLEKDNFIFYSIFYPELKRNLTLKLTKKFPFTIEGWQESTTRKGIQLTTKAEKIKTIQSAYWNKNRITDIEERKILGL